jgi:high affinity Mn2+ porin
MRSGARTKHESRLRTAGRLRARRAARGGLVCLALALTPALASPARAQGNGWPSWAPRIVGAQFTLVLQNLRPFPAAYGGANSLGNLGDTQATHTYGLYLGARLARWLQAYADGEMALGAGVSHATGLGGLTNGDVIRQGSVDLSKAPYVARLFLRVLIPLGADTERVERGPDQLAAVQPRARLEVKAGKLAASDDFDQNRYANSTRTQFMNWGLWNNSAWDFAADTRGYSWGLVVAWVRPAWEIRLGTYQMPTFANGNVFDGDIAHARGDNLQLTLRAGALGTVLRFLAYQNHGRMGVYADALARATTAGTVPDIVADDQPDRVKYGLGFSAEQPISDDGETGAFFRAGWNDGRTEDFCFTEVDRHLSLGLQAAGTRWGRHEDRLGLALLRHGLSPDHARYLEAGGSGFLLGDGRLDYSHELIAELYYRVQAGPFLELSPDFQHVWNPGYNRDRGPATVLSLRLNARY